MALAFNTQLARKLVRGRSPEVADRLGIHTGTLATRMGKNVEHVTLSFVNELAVILDIDPQELLVVNTTKGVEIG